MAGTMTGVFPVYKNQFKVGAASASMNTIADMETFSVSFDNGVEEWTPFDTEGWVRRLMAAKSITITVNGKRNVGDAGNNFVAGLAMKNGTEAQGTLEWTFPDGAKLTLDNAVFNITELGSGDSTNVGPLSFTVMSNGKPTYTAAGAA